MEVKIRSSAATRKKTVVLLLDLSTLKGYLNPAALAESENLDLLTPDGEHRAIPQEDIKAVYFVDDLSLDHEPERKSFLSRPKIEGLWLKLTFRDRDTLEGIVKNELLEILDRGIQLVPPDLHGNCSRIYVPRSALVEVKVLGVVGAAKRMPRPAAVAASAQPKLFEE
jgi:hypothetical protein